MSEAPSHWPGDLQALQGAWHTVTSGIAEARASKKESTVTRWRDALAVLVEKRAALVAAGDWHAHGPADLLTIAGYGRTEVAHTAILGWLLGPAREHGLGSAMLDAVLGEVGLPPVGAADQGLVRVTTEEVRQHRRADIVVRFPGRVLVIEAKVDADESVDQCNDLHALFGDEPDAVFVFLTPSGRAPTSATGAAAEAFRTLSLRWVRDLLGVLLASDAVHAGARGGPAVRTYHQTLEAQFPRRQPMQIDARLRFYFENKRILDEWAGLGADARTAADAFFRTLVEPMRALASKLGEDVQLHVNLDSAHPKLLLQRASWLGPGGGIRAGIGLEWQKGGATFDKSYTGVWVNRSAMDKSAPLHAAISKAIDARHLPKESRTAWWPMWSYQPTPPGEWWLDLPAFREQLIERIASRWDALAPCVDEANQEVS